jgi:hypothetical protein
MSFDHTKIKTLNLNFNSGSWNAKTHNLLASCDPKNPSGILIKLIPVEEDVTPITNFTQANNILNKFRKQV